MELSISVTRLRLIETAEEDKVWRARVKKQWGGAKLSCRVLSAKSVPLGTTPPKPLLDGENSISWGDSLRVPVPPVKERPLLIQILSHAVVPPKVVASTSFNPSGMLDSTTTTAATSAGSTPPVPVIAPPSAAATASASPKPMTTPRTTTTQLRTITETLHVFPPASYGAQTVHGLVDVDLHVPHAVSSSSSQRGAGVAIGGGSLPSGSSTPAMGHSSTDESFAAANNNTSFSSPSPSQPSGATTTPRLRSSSVVANYPSGSGGSSMASMPLSSLDYSFGVVRVSLRDVFFPSFLSDADGTFMISNVLCVGNATESKQLWVRLQSSHKALRCHPLGGAVFRPGQRGYFSVSLDSFRAAGGWAELQKATLELNIVDVDFNEAHPPVPFRIHTKPPECSGKTDPYHYWINACAVTNRPPKSDQDLGYVRSVLPIFLLQSELSDPNMMVGDSLVAATRSNAGGGGALAAPSVGSSQADQAGGRSFKAGTPLSPGSHGLASGVGGARPNSFDPSMLTGGQSLSSEGGSSTSPNQHQQYQQTVARQSKMDLTGVTILAHIHLGVLRGVPPSSTVVDRRTSSYKVIMTCADSDPCYEVVRAETPTVYQSVNGALRWDTELILKRHPDDGKLMARSKSGGTTVSPSSSAALVAAETAAASAAKSNEDEPRTANDNAEDGEDDEATPATSSTSASPTLPQPPPTPPRRGTQCASLTLVEVSPNGDEEIPIGMATLDLWPLHRTAMQRPVPLSFLMLDCFSRYDGLRTCGLAARGASVKFSTVASDE